MYQDVKLYHWDNNMVNLCNLIYIIVAILKAEFNLKIVILTFILVITLELFNNIYFIENNF